MIYNNIYIQQFIYDIVSFTNGNGNSRLSLEMFLSASFMMQTLIPITTVFWLYNMRAQVLLSLWSPYDLKLYTNAS